VTFARRPLLALLVALLVLPRLADAAPYVRIEAEVDPSLRFIRGHLTMQTDETVGLVDPLASLPAPRDDLVLRRTFPGPVERGVVQFEAIDDDTWWFYALLPKRWEDVGSTRYGLFANGSWYPQPMVGQTVPIVEWEVTVRLPDGTVGALGDAVGERVLSWRGEGERVSLAVVPHGRVSDVAADGVHVAVVTRGRPRRVLLHELHDQLVAIRPEGETLRGTVVEAPLRRRLVRPGLGLAYVSDHAWRLTPGLRRFHRVSVTRGVVQAMLPLPDPYERELAASLLSRRHAEVLTGASAARALGWGAWLPSVYALVHSERMPFHSEVLELTHPGDPLADDLLERLDPHTPGTVVVAQIEDAWGLDAAWKLGDAIRHGSTLEDAALAADLPFDWLDGWRAPYPEQDYYLRVTRDPPSVRVIRVAPPDAQEEVVVVRVDGATTTWMAGPGRAEHVIEQPDDLDHVTIDPDRHTRQTTRLADAWPARFEPTFWAAVDDVALHDGTFWAAAGTSVRRSWDTHNLWSGMVYHDLETLFGVTLEVARREGPLLDGWRRPHRLSVSISPALLDPDYADDGRGGVALGGALKYAWDRRVDAFFPLRGERLWMGVDGGVVPGTEHTWAGANLGATALASPHPRLALALTGHAGVARGDVTHRLLDLGGASGLVSIDPGLVVGTRRGVARGELRGVAVRSASVPLLLAWADEVQLTGGGEVGSVWAEGAHRSAVGVTAGAAITGDQLGLDTALVGLTVGWPLWVEGLDVATGWQVPRAYLRWTQAF
jgi:hypothetical protein